MVDNKLLCVVALRMEAAGEATMIAKYDHTAQDKAHAGSGSSSLYGARDKDFSKAVKAAVVKDPPGSGNGGFGGFKVIQDDIHQLVYGADISGLCIAVVTGSRYPSRVAINMLEEIYTQFTGRFRDDVTMAPTNSLTKKAKKLLSEHCKKYYDPRNVDKAQKVSSQIDDVRGKMADNIAGVLRNTEKAETLAKESDHLNKRAYVFKKKAEVLNREMKWKKWKMVLIVAIVVIATILVIIL